MSEGGDFLYRNSTFFLSVLGVLSTCFAAMLSYALKSRCTTISCCGLRCERDVLPPDVVVNTEMDRTRHQPVEVIARQTS